MSSSVAAIVPAAGSGKRLKARLHKPFVLLAGRPILAWTLQALEETAPIDEVVLVVHPSDVKAGQRLIRRYRFRKVKQVVAGGDARSASVFQGLEALPPDSKWVVVHDGSRPLVTPELLLRTLESARRYRAAIAAVPVVPTVKQASRGWVKATLDRSSLWAVQTPQVFWRDLLERAHERARAHGITATDDATLVEALGHRVRIVPGEFRNLKVTTPEDLLLVEALLRNRL